MKFSDSGHISANQSLLDLEMTTSRLFVPWTALVQSRYLIMLF
jgi:hypothetical protein